METTQNYVSEDAQWENVSSRTIEILQCAHNFKINCCLNVLNPHFKVSIANRVFHKLDEIKSNANIGIRGFTTWKQQFPVTKSYPQWGLNPGLWLTSNSKSNTILFELTGHLLVRLRL